MIQPTVVLLAMIVATAWPAGENARTTRPVRPQELSSELIHRASEEVLSDRDFRRLREAPRRDEKGLLQRILEWIEKLLESEEDSRPRQPGSGSGFSGASQFILVAALTLVVGLIVFIGMMVFRSLGSRNRQAAAGPALPDNVVEIATTPPGEIAANEYQRRAAELARQGNFAAGIRELLLGSMSWIERAGLIRFRRGLTNRDYWRAVFRDERRREAFAAVALEFEKVYFGRRVATAEMYESCARSFERGFVE